MVRASLGIEEGPLVLAVARHEWAKGLDVLIKAIPQIKLEMPSAHVRIAGPEGSQSQALKRLARQLGIDPHTLFLGQRNDAVDLLSAADVVCIPSRTEGYTNVMIESMAFGTPLVASSIAPLTELDPMVRWARFATLEDEHSLARSVNDALVDRHVESRRSTGVEPVRSQISD